MPKNSRLYLVVEFLRKDCWYNMSPNNKYVTKAPNNKYVTKATKISYREEDGVLRTPLMCWSDFMLCKPVVAVIGWVSIHACMHLFQEQGVLKKERKDT